MRFPKMWDFQKCLWNLCSSNIKKVTDLASLTVWDPWKQHGTAKKGKPWMKYSQIGIVWSKISKTVFKIFLPQIWRKLSGPKKCQSYVLPRNQLHFFNPFTLSPIWTPKVSHWGAPLLKIMCILHPRYSWLYIKNVFDIAIDIKRFS